MKRIKKLMVLILTAAMVLGLAPVTVRAAGINTIWNFENETAGATLSVATIAQNDDRGTMTATVSANGGYLGGKAIKYSIISPSSTASSYQTCTMQLKGGSIDGYQLNTGDILWFYLKSDTDVNYSMRVQFRNTTSTLDFTTQTIYTLNTDNTVSEIKRVSKAVVSDSGLAFEANTSIVVGKDFKGWVGIPITSDDTTLTASSLKRIDFFFRTSKSYTAAIGAGSNIYIDNLVVSTDGLVPALTWVNKPTKTSYTVGNNLNVTGGSFVANYVDSSSEEVNLTSAMVTGFDNLNAGTQALTVTYKGATVTYDIKMAAIGSTRQSFWNVDTMTNSSTFPDKDTTTNRGSMNFSVADNIGVDGTKAFVMTMESAATTGSSGIVNGTKNAENWLTSGVTGVTGFTPLSEVKSGDIFWFWVSNKMGQPEYVVSEFAYIDSNNTISKASTGDGPTRTNVLYTISNGKIVTLAPGSKVGKIENHIYVDGVENAGAILVDNGGSGWIGIPLYDIKALRGNRIVGTRLYLRSLSGDDNGDVNKKFYFDEFYVCSLGYYPGSSAQTLSSVSVRTLPDKTAYYTGEPLNTYGGKLNVNYGNGYPDVVDITTDMTSGYDPVPATYGTKPITVSYGGMTDTFKITITEDTAAYRHQLLNIDSLSVSSTLPLTDNVDNRGSSAVSLVDGGLRGSRAMAMTVTGTSTDRSGIINGIAGNWNSVTGFSASREIRQGDIFWIWAKNGFSNNQYLVFEFYYTINGTSVRAGTKASTERTTPIYTITDDGGTPVITTIAPGSNVNGITNMQSARGVIHFISGVSGWVGIPLDNIATEDGVGLWGASIYGVRIYARNANETNGIVGESIIIDEPWVTSAGLMPNLSDDTLLNIVPENSMRLELRETVTALFYVTPDVEVGEDEKVVFHVEMGGLTRDVEGTLITEGAFTGKYSLYVDNIVSTRYTDNITGTIAVAKTDGSSEYVFKTLTDEDGISVAGYCDRLIATYPDDTTLQHLMANLLLFGDEAQLYTSHNIGSLPTTGRSWVESYKKSFDIPGSDMAVVTPPVNASVASIRSAALRVSGKVAIRFVVQAVNTSDAVVRVTSGTYSKEFSLSDDESVTARGDNKYEVVIETILPQHYGKVYTAEMVVNGDTVHAVTYSVNSYIYSKHADSDVGGFVTALNNYGCAAVAYVANH